MSATTTTDATDRADAYLAQVRRHLATLTDDERDDLLDDLTAHVHEVAASRHGPLVDVLGTPETFAAELLAAAGLAPTGSAGPGGAARHTAASLVSWTSTVRSHPWTRAVADFLPELRPAWWVARGWLLVYGLWLIGAEDRGSLPLPELFDSALLGVIAAVAASVVSVRLARRSSPPRYLIVIDLLAVVAALVLLLRVDDLATGPTVDYVGYQGAPVASGTLAHADGSPITNIHAYGADGEPLEQVRLFDQHGRPIEIHDATGEWGEPLVSEVVVGADGLPAANVYPLDQYALTWDNVRQAETRVPVPDPVLQLAPLPPTTASSTTTTSPTATTAPDRAATTTEPPPVGAGPPPGS